MIQKKYYLSRAREISDEYRRRAEEDQAEADQWLEKRLSDEVKRINDMVMDMLGKQK